MFFIGGLATNVVKGQTFTMSSVGSFAGTSSVSNAVQFKSIAACIDVQTGVAVLSGVRNTGDFAVNCEVSLKINSLGIKMFPVPAQNFTKVKFVNTPPLSNEFNLTVWTSDGVQLMQRKETGYNLFQGITLDVSMLQAGTYVLKIESTQYVDAIKFIKGY
jgi:hypothetical protein